MMNRKLALTLLFTTTLSSCWAFTLKPAPGKSVYTPSLVRGVDYAIQRNVLVGKSHPLVVQPQHHFVGSEHTIHHSKTNNKEEKEESNSTGRKILVKAVDSIIQLFSFGIQVAGVFFSLGLVFNLCGYGYQVSMEHGLEIDKINTFRQELQWRREIQGTATTTNIRLLDNPSVSLPR